MRQRVIALPELALIGATRGMLGLGLGLRIADRLGKRQRAIVGTILLLVGTLSTIPLALRVFRRKAVA